MRHRYGDHVHQFADLLLPRETDAPLPVAVLLHAGFWREQYSLDLAEDIARDLAQRGWAAWNVEYRRVGETSGGGYPATLEDVAAAIDFLQTRDAPLDLARVVTVGHSAAGQLPPGAAPPDAPRGTPPGAPGGGGAGGQARGGAPRAGGGAPGGAGGAARRRRVAGRHAGLGRRGPRRPGGRGGGRAHGGPCRRAPGRICRRVADRAPAA